jgi:hypothetical protein
MCNMHGRSEQYNILGAGYRLEGNGTLNDAQICSVNECRNFGIVGLLWHH